MGHCYKNNKNYKRVVNYLVSKGKNKKEAEDYALRKAIATEGAMCTNEYALKEFNAIHGGDKVFASADILNTKSRKINEKGEISKPEIGIGTSVDTTGQNITLNFNTKDIVNIKELESIKRKAIADGTFMKAPNGKPTKLNEQQWLQVRTTSFKDWFGDWENDSSNASKVVDENGEPLVVYHGSNNFFTIFDKNRRGENTFANSSKLGFFFASNENAAAHYASNLFTPISIDSIKKK